MNKEDVISRVMEAKNSNEFGSKEGRQSFMTEELQEIVRDLRMRGCSIALIFKSLKAQGIMSYKAVISFRAAYNKAMTATRSKKKFVAKNKAAAKKSNKRGAA